MASILVIDEYDGFLETVRYGLSRFGHAVRCARDVATAKGGGIAGVELVLLDLGWPQAAGLKACAQLRSCPELAEKPIVAMTAFFSPGIERTAEAAGAVAVIPKPFEWTDLLALIERCVPPESGLEPRAERT